MLFLDLLLAEIGQYVDRTHHIVRGLQYARAAAVGREREELTVAYEQFSLLAARADAALQALRLLQTTPFPQFPRYPITNSTRHVLDDLLCDVQTAQSQLDVITEATAGTIISVPE